jgi:hypothetical protein
MKINLLGFDIGLSSVAKVSTLAKVSTDKRANKSTFDVGCSMLDVGCLLILFP